MRGGLACIEAHMVTTRLMIVLGFILLVFAVAVMLGLLPAIIAGLLLLLGLQAVHGCRFEVFHRVDQVLVRLMVAQWKGPPCTGIDCDV